MTARTRVAGLALALTAPAVTVPVLPGLTGLVAPAAAATEQGQPCSVDNPQLIDQRSPILENLAIGQSWRFATGAGTVVAVVDSGVNTGNVHLPAGTAVLPGTSFVPGDTGDGRTDVSGHGTVVAGIIAARPVDGSGVVGAAPNAKILPVRVYTNDGPNAQETDVAPTGARIAQGIRWAVANGADVVNVSLSVASTNVDLAAIRSAVDLARERDVLVVASTGNSPTGDSGEPSQEPRYPAATDGVIGVAATNAQGVVDAYSFQGPQVDLAAPGSSVLVAFQAAGDCQTEPTPFTSWAAPFVSALAAQLRERYPDASAAEIEYLMTSTARRPVTGSRDDTEGWGLIQPYEALTVDVDKRRPGPDAEAVTDEGSRTGQSAEPLGVSTDELAPVRREALWWWIGGAGLAAVGLLLRPVVRRRTTGHDGG